MKEIPVREFRNILRKFERVIDTQNQSACCCNVTVPQCHLLMELDRSDDTTLNELSARLGLDKSSVSRTVESLVNKGMVDRIIPKDNRRTTRIRLTKQGKDTCRTINRDNDKYFKKVLASIPVIYKEGFLIGFRALAETMEATENKVTRKL